jgi:hypothetical protein
MRGNYFVKHLKGNSGDQIQKLASCQATRTKVAHMVVYAKTTWNWMEIHSSTTTCRSAKLFGRRLQSAYLNLQTNLMVVITSKEKLLKSLIPTKRVVSCRVIANKRKFGIVEHACLLIRLVESCHHQFVAAATHHLTGITKNPFHNISVHGSRVNTLALYHTVELNDGDVAQQQ